jgi:hypothetical protein
MAGLTVRPANTLEQDHWQQGGAQKAPLNQGESQFLSAERTHIERALPCHLKSPLLFPLKSRISSVILVTASLSKRHNGACSGSFNPGLPVKNLGELSVNAAELRTGRS